MAWSTRAAFGEAERLRTAEGRALSAARVEELLEQRTVRSVQLHMLWAYYRNPMRSIAGGRGYSLGQERGLPHRLRAEWDRRGTTGRGGPECGGGRREVVVENDIAWRVQTMVDFMFGRPITIASLAADERTRGAIQQALAHVWDSSGGIALLQDIALMGHVYGHVDLVVRSAQNTQTERGTDSDSAAGEPLGGEGGPDRDRSQDATPRERIAGGGSHSKLDLERAGDSVRIDVIEPPRGVALLSSRDERSVQAYVIRSEGLAADCAGRGPGETSGAAGIAAGVFKWWRRARPGRPAAPEDGSECTTEVFAGATRQVYRTDDQGRTWLVAEEPALVEARAGDVPPIVHVQNISQPFRYSGIGEVEPLIPLQDELNTRLSDRANRVTMQSFKMYLAKGLEGAASMPVAPGMVWATDNPEAEITAFGGDASSPSEDNHIEQIREAMDKASAVPPLASGVVRAKIGNLSSENALRITLLGLMSKTNRKRVTYGRGIVAASRLVLEALDRLGILRTREEDRELRIDWPDPIPRDEQLALLAAQKKVELGVPRERVLSELGY